MADVKIRIIGEDNTGDAVRSVERNLGGLGEKLSGALGVGLKGLAIGAGAAVTAIGGIGTAALGAGMQMDEAFDAIAIGTGATGDELDALKESFKSAFAAGPTGAEDVSASLVSLNQKLGLSGTALETMTVQVGNLARITGGDAKTLADAFGRSIGDWGIASEDASTALDKFYVASQNTGIGVDTLMQRIVQFGAPLRLMGFSLDESIALLGKWEKEGVNTELVLGSLRIAAGKFAEDNIPLRDGLMQTMEAIKGAATESEALGTAMETFGARAGPDMAAAIREGRFSIDDLVAQMGEAKGAINETSDATADFPEKFETMKNKATLALAPLGGVIMDGIGKALDWLGPKLDELFKWFEANGPEIERIAGEVFAAVGEILKTVGQVITEVVIPAVQDIAKWVTDNWPTIRAVAETVFGVVKTVVEAVATVITTIVIPAVEAVHDFIKDNWPTIKTIAETVFGAIKTIVQGVVTFITTTVIPAFQSIVTFVTENWPKLKAVAELVFTAIKRTVQDVVLSIQRAVEGIAESIRTFFTGIFDGIVQALKSSPLYELYQIATGQKALPEIKAPEVQVNIREGSLIDQLFGGGKQMGGPVLPRQAYLVGERGPELFVPSQRGNIVPNHALAGAGGETVVNLQLDGTTLARVVMDRMTGMVYEDSRRYG